MTEVKIGFKQTESGEIPEKWGVARLGDVVKELKNGFASGKRDENGIVQIRMNNVTTDGRLIFDSYLKVPVPENLNYWLLKKGDLLFNNTNSIDLVGKSAIFNEAPFPCTFSNHFTRIRFKKELVLPELILYHFIIMWEKSFFKSVAIRHVGQSAVHTDYLLKLQIPLPPLPEQRRIAEVLGTVDSAIQSVGGAIESTERLKKGLMQRLLTKGIGHERFKESEVGRVPEGWGVVRLGDESITEIRGNKTVNKFERVAFVPMEFVSDSDIFVKYETRPMKDVKSFTYSERGDLLLAKITPSLENGKQGIIPDSIPNGFALATTEVFPISCKGIDRFFLFYVLKFPKFRNKIISSMIGTTGRQRASKESVEKLQIPLPPLPEQHCIAGILSTVDRKLELERRRKEKLERVKKGLMNELLTGRKRIKVD
jgi:type I restriction enzyme S subunit